MIWLQLLTAAFAVACAGLNKYPVALMRAYWTQGSHRKQEREFHAANAVVKVLWAMIPLYIRYFTDRFPHGIPWYNLGQCLLLLLVEWLVFDPALNLFTGKPWHYLGQTAWLDKLLRFGFTIRLFKWKIVIPGFHDQAGIVKAVVVLALIIALNFIL